MVWRKGKFHVEHIGNWITFFTKNFTQNCSSDETARLKVNVQLSYIHTGSRYGNGLKPPIMFNETTISNTEPENYNECVFQISFLLKLYTCYAGEITHNNSLNSKFIYHKI